MLIAQMKHMSHPKQVDQNLMLRLANDKMTITTKLPSIRSLQMDAKQGNTRAMVLLGYRFQEGVSAIQDYRKAVYWYDKAVKANDPMGMLFMGQCFQYGFGLKRDWKQAAVLFRRSYRMGISISAAHLGHLYQWGTTNFKANKRLAISWYKKAVIKGGDRSPRAALCRKMLAELMKSRQ